MKKLSAKQKKVYIIDWYSECQKKLQKLGFTSGDGVEPEKMFEVAKTIFESGLNIMLYRSPETGNTIIGVDTRRFQQR